MDNLFSNNIEDKYLETTPLEHRKSLGQFFTPFQVAYFMSEWLISNEKNRISLLDPAAGLGVFSRALEKAIKDRKITSEIEHNLYEIDTGIATQLQKLLTDLNDKIVMHNEDFLKSGWDKHYDAIIANPPYYKHHFIQDKEKIRSEISKQTKHNFSAQTNIYCWFLVKSFELLKQNGRLAFIVPTEFFNSNYGTQVKDYLKKSGMIIHLINVDFTESVFNDALTTSVIILAEKRKDKQTKINFYTVKKIGDLNNLSLFLKKHPYKTYDLKELNPKDKWRNYFNGNHNGIKKDNLVLFSIYGRFSRGIATGANSYFTLNDKEAFNHNLPKDSLIPCITRAAHIKSVVFNKDRYYELQRANKKIYLFDGEKRPENQGCRDYIKLGEEQGVHNRYLTKNRDPWYALEKRGESFIWAYVFGRSGLKFVWNETNCLNLTCFHSFYPTMFGEKCLDILFIYLNTKLSKQLLDLEKREYGGGLGKYEPNDINRAYVLNFEKLRDKQLHRLEGLQRDFIKNPNRVELINEAETIFRNIY